MKKRDLRTYRIWLAMKARCYAPSNKNTGYYQKDGIQVCEEWRNSYEKFMEDMGEPTCENPSIERKDNLKDYCKENCIWIPAKEQSKNRRNCLMYEYNGETKNLKDWARYFNMNYDTLRARIVKYGLSFEDAIKDDPYDRLVEINGENKTVTEWCNFFGINAGSVFSRISDGWSKVDAILKNQEDIVQQSKKLD